MGGYIFMGLSAALLVFGIILMIKQKRGRK